MQTSAYLDLQYFHRRSSTFPAEYLSLLLEWFTPFFNAITPCVQYFVSSFYLSINIVVLYQFTVTYQKLRVYLQLKCEVSWTEKRFKSAIMFSSRQKCSREERNGFVKAYVKQLIIFMYLPDFFALNSLATTVYTRSTFYPVCSPHSEFYTHPFFTLSLHFTPGPQSAVHILRFTLTVVRLPCA